MHRALAGLLMVLLVCCALIFLGLGKRGLWVPDETRYAAVTKEIVDSGDWITLRLNGDIYHEKPPVFFWLMAASGLLLRGFSEFSMRLPSAVSAAGCVLATYLLARRLFDEKVALLSGLILVTSLAFLGASRWVILDPVLTLCVVSAISLLYLGLTQCNTRAAAYLSASVLMAAGTLTKGPVGFILPLLVLIVYSSIVKRLRAMFTKELFFGLLLFLLIILCWLIPACLKGGEAYTKELLLRQIFGRYFKPFSHRQPFYFYFVKFPLEFLPWTLLLPSAGAFLVKRKAGEERVKFIFVWFSAIFLFFTFSASKNDLYILPAYPAASMAIAYYLTDRPSARIRGFFTTAVIFVTALSFTLNLFVLPRFDIYKSTKNFAREINGYVKPEQQLRTFQLSPVHWLYYCNRRRIEELDDYGRLKEYMRSSQRVFCIIEHSKYEEFIRSCGFNVYTLSSAPFGLRAKFRDFFRPQFKSKSTFVLMSNRMQ